jgi:flagellar assembly factor FliW
MTDDEIILTFPEGLAGFPEAKTFRLFEPSDGYPLKFLQAIEVSNLSFVCMDAAAIKKDYEVPLSEVDAEQLALNQPEDAMVLAMVVVPEDPRKMTANLAGPLVVNSKTRRGKQIILDTREFPLKYPVFASKEDVIVEFDEGLIGFPEFRTFRLFEPLGGYPMKFLQSVDKEDVSFTCIDTGAIKPDYEVPLSQEDADRLAIVNVKDALVLALVVIPDDPRKMTANLAGPLVINTLTLKGRQVVLNTELYPLKYPILSEP